jgi:hypothetical protein
MDILDTFNEIKTIKERDMDSNMKWPHHQIFVWEFK